MRGAAVYLPQQTSQLPINILRITCIFWLAAKIISYPAWIAVGRLYPVVPALDGFEAVQPIVHDVLFWASIGLMALLLLFPRLKVLAILLIIAELSSCLLDVARWQPWEYQYLFITFVFCYSLDKPKVFYNALAFLISSVYIFSGLHKLNGGFLYTVWENMILRSFGGVSRAQIASLQLHYVGLALPAIELLCGLALLFMRNKKWPAFALIAMHFFNLLFLGPWGLNYNMAVWPWNVAMMAFLYLLFIQNSQQFLPSFLFAGWNRLVLLCFGILPVLSFWGLWESHFSSNLYSGKTMNLAVCVDDKEIPELKTHFSKDNHNICNGTTMLKVQKWAFSELNLPPYPEEWYYRKLVKEFKRQHPKVQASFYIYQYPYKESIEIR